MVDQARRRLITDEKAKELILKRWLKTLQDTVTAIYRPTARIATSRGKPVAEIHHTPISSILSERRKKQLLNQYLRELGYE